MPFLLAIPAIVLGETLTIVGWTGLFTGTIANCAMHKHCGRSVPVIDLENVPRANVEAVGGGSARAGIVDDRADVGPCNVPRYNFDQCHQQLHAQGKRIDSSQPSAGVVQFNGIPPACMDLASVLAGSCTGAGIRPTPCGSACMQYSGLSAAQLAQLSKILMGKK